jgi:integrase
LRRVEFCILTAVRSGEARGARWSEIDMAAKVWRIPRERMKADEPHDVPLSKQALALLDRLPRTGDLIFPGERRGVALHFSTALVETKRIAPEVTLHGMRATFSSWCGDHSVPREIKERALAHAVGNAVEAAYDRTSLLERRRPVMAQWGAFLSGEADAAKVVKLAGRKRR